MLYEMIFKLCNIIIFIQNSFNLYTIYKRMHCVQETMLCILWSYCMTIYLHIVVILYDYIF